MPYSGKQLYEVRIWFQQQDDAVDEPTKAKQSQRKEVENAHTGFSLVKFVRTQIAEEQAQKKSNPLVFDSVSQSCVNTVGVHVGICVIDDDVGLLGCCFFDLLYLTAAKGTKDSVLCDLTAAILAELGSSLCLDVVLFLRDFTRSLSLMNVLQIYVITYIVL